MNKITILKREDNNILNSVVEMVELNEGGMSDFQINNFVLSTVNFPTNSGMYHQCLREVSARYDSIVNMQHEYNLMEINVRRMEYKINNDRALVEFDEDELKENVRFEKLKMNKIKRRAATSIREMSVFTKKANELKDIIPDSEKDDKGNPVKEKGELEFWLNKQAIAQHGQAAGPFPAKILTPENVEERISALAYSVTKVIE